MEDIVGCTFNLIWSLQTRELFVLNVEASNFIQYCYRWLLPALVLHNDVSNLNWVAKVGFFNMLETSYCYYLFFLIILMVE